MNLYLGFYLFEALGKNSQQLVEAEKGYGRFVVVDRYETDMEKQREASQKTETTMYEVSLFIEKHRIYLTEICQMLKMFLDIMWNNVINVGVYGSIEYPTPQTSQEKRAAFTKAYEALEKKIPSARTALENEFRNLLGVEENTPRPKVI